MPPLQKGPPEEPKLPKPEKQRRPSDLVRGTADPPPRVSSQNFLPAPETRRRRFKRRCRFKGVFGRPKRLAPPARAAKFKICVEAPGCSCGLWVLWDPG